MDDENKSCPIPERFRASADLTDEAAFALLKKNDAEQLALSQQVQSPFTRSSPRDLYRRKAKVTIETLLKFQPWSDDQREQYCEAQASLGRYDIAADTTKVHREIYEKIWEAIFRDDNEICPHPADKMHVSEYVWSIKVGKELPLVRCNVCGFINVVEKSAEMVAASKARAQHQGRTQNMTMAQIQQYHAQNVTKNGRQ